MRVIVFAAFLAMLAQSAQAEPPSSLRRCDGPYNCITINTGPCGTIMTNDRNGITAGVVPVQNSAYPRIEGICGFYSPPYYAQETPPPLPAAAYFPSVFTNSNPQ